MKSIVELEYGCTNSIFNFFHNKTTLEEFIMILKSYENFYRDYMNYTDENKSLWFKFGKDDTLSTTISNIEKDLNLPVNHSNHILLLNKFESVLGLNDDERLLVYFS